MMDGDRTFVKSAVQKKREALVCGTVVEETTTKQEVSGLSPIPRILCINFM